MVEGNINYQEVVGATSFITEVSNSMLTRVKNNCNAVSERTALVGFSSQTAQTAIDNYLSSTVTNISELVTEVVTLSEYIKNTVPAAYQNIEEEVKAKFAYEAEGVMNVFENFEGNGNYPQ